MGELYERILGQHPVKPKIAVHALLAIVAEQQRGAITTEQAQTILDNEYGGRLGLDQTGSEAGLREITDLIATVPAGTTTAIQLARIARLQLLDNVFLLSDLVTPPYDNPAFLRTRLGVPDRS